MSPAGLSAFRAPLPPKPPTLLAAAHLSGGLEGSLKDRCETSPHVVLGAISRVTTERQGAVSPQHDPKMNQSDEGPKGGGAGRFLARRWRRAAAAVVLSMVGAVLPWPTLAAYAVHDTGLFELDGNV